MPRMSRATTCPPGQIDFDAALLQADIDGHVYLKLSSGCGVDVPPGYCVKLRKSLYGTKQAAFLWSNALKRLMVAQGFRQSLADPCLWIYSDRKSTSMSLPQFGPMMVVFVTTAHRNGVGSMTR